MTKSKNSKSLNIKVPSAILANRELSTTEKLILALDYSFSGKKGFNALTNVDVGKLLQLHQNVIGKYRKQLIENGYLEKDAIDKRKFILTDKLRKVKIALINGKEDNRTIIIPFEIYNHPELNPGSKLLWGEYNSMSRTEKGYFQKRETTAMRFNVSTDSITNWTKELEKYDFLEEYTVKSGYHTKQKIVRTKDLRKTREDIESDIDDDFDDDF